MINKARQLVPERTLKWFRRKLAHYFENVDQSNESGSVTMAELNVLLKQLYVVEITEDAVSSQLDGYADDAEFQLMSDDIIIVQVRKPNSDDDNSESDGHAGNLIFKNNQIELFESFGKRLMWLDNRFSLILYNLCYWNNFGTGWLNNVPHAYDRINFRLSQCKVCIVCI